MKYKTKVSLECSYGLGRPWELQEAIVEHDVILSYQSLREAAIKAVGGSYVTYGAMCIIDEEMSDA